MRFSGDAAMGFTGGDHGSRSTETVMCTGRGERAAWERTMIVQA
jgi:hypothetical protein